MDTTPTPPAGLLLLQRPARTPQPAAVPASPCERRDNLADYHAARRWRSRLIALLLRRAWRRAARWLRRVGAPRARCAAAADTW